MALREEHDEIGVATGVAWTEAGGDLMSIEVTLMTGKGNLQLTGQLGDVMKESAQAAYSYVRSRAEGAGDQLAVLGRVGHPRAHPGRRHPQGRALGRHHHVPGNDFRVNAPAPYRATCA